MLGTFSTRKALYRVSLNGSMQLLASTSGTGAGGIDVPAVMDGGFNHECFELVNKWPSASPDGTRVAFENQTGNRVGYSVRILTIATRSVTEIAAGGQRPQWSPSGELIAYTANDRIVTIRPDGTGARAVSPPGRKYVPGVKWSPDGRWIFAAFEPRVGWAGTTLTMLDVNTGLEIPLSWSTAYGSYSLPAWKP